MSDKYLMESMAITLKSIDDLIGEAVDRKVRTGRMPSIEKLLSTIQDSASAMVDEYEQKKGKLREPRP